MSLKTPNWITRDVARSFLRQLDAMAFMMPRVKRVRRRGFPAHVRRGSTVRYNGDTYEVIKRSPWNLWLAKYAPPMRVGDTISVKLPKRFQTP